MSDAPIPAMTSQEERDCFRRLACELAGDGAIVELGAWLGAGTVAIAAGIRDSGQQNVVHSYDRFKWDPRTHGPKAGGLQVSNLYQTYRANLGSLASYVRSYKGEIEDQQWSGGPIALLVCDAPKRLDPIRHVLSIFGPRLKEGSVMAWQDFCFPPAYAIAACLYLIRDKIEFREAVDYTIVFTIKQPWSVADVSRETLSLKWSDDAVVESMVYWRKILPPDQFVGVMCGATLFLSDIGHAHRGRTLLRPLIHADKDLEAKLLQIKKTRPVLANRYKELFREIS
jgi:hypothetical protein